MTEVVIKLPDEVYEDVKATYNGTDVLYCAVKYGIPLPKGQWTPLLDNDGSPTLEETYGKVYRCSTCGFISYGENFCGNCGAKMEVENDTNK